MSRDFCSRTSSSHLLVGRAQNIRSFFRDRMQRSLIRLFTNCESGCANLRCRNKERRFLDRYVFSAKGA